jgi:phage terminase large subunit-like protein
VSHVEQAATYVADVLSGRIVACRWIKLACQRHLDDLERAKGEVWPYRYDEKKANRACKFIEKLPHVKGKWAKAADNTIHLENWQAFAICSIFGWVHKETEKRRFNKADLFVARKNAKSTLAAGIGLYMLCADGEPGAEIYAGASTEAQAWKVFEPAQRMAKNKPELLEHYDLTVNAASIVKGDGSIFQTMPGKPGDGASPQLAIIDEYHEHDTSEQFDAMETGMGAREQPLLLVISTSGFDVSGPCYGEWDACRAMLEGTIPNDALFALIYTLDSPEEWTTENGLRKANPNYGVSVLTDKLLQNQHQAKHDLRKENAFKVKHCNIWVNARESYIDMDAWAAGNREIQLQQFHGQDAVLSLDLASREDIAALEIAIPQESGEIVRFGKYYLPRATVEKTRNQHYQLWTKAGWITVTDGNIINFKRIHDDILELAQVLNVLEIVFDPYQATMLISMLQDSGLTCVEYKNIVPNMSEPMKEMDAMVKARTLLHCADPVMTWQMSNLVAKIDAKENVFPRKDKPEKKIDSVVALIMAVGRIMAKRNYRDDSADFNEAIANPVCL